MIAPAPIADTFEADLASLAEEIRQLHRQTTIEGVLAIGERLDVANTELAQRGNGRFGKWIESEFDFSRMTANKYMTVYRTFGSEDCKSRLQTIPLNSVYDLARQPESVRAAALQLAESGTKVTPKKVRELAQQTLFVEEEKPALPADAICTDDLDSLFGQKFGTIMADPPWQYGNTATRSNVENEYAGTMTVDEICDMPVAGLAADDAHLHLWTTNGFLQEAFQVMLAWGFTYKSAFVWVKPQMGIGNYWRVSHEFMLLGVRGNAKRFNERCHKSWLQADRTKHSAKPDEVRRLIEKVSPGPFLELFGRKPVAGWTVFGNEIDERACARGERESVGVFPQG